MTNLLNETVDSIHESGHSVEDITFIGSSDARYSCTWGEFERLADREYDSGYGAPEVATDLVIRFTDGRKMWRAEYDGSEWWTFNSPDDIDYSKPGLPIGRLIGGMWASVNEMQSYVADAKEQS